MHESQTRLQVLSTAIPTEADAAAIAYEFCGTEPARVHRFATGLGHWVYDVLMTNGASFVVRLAKTEQRDDFLGAVHWSNTLRPIGVPLPAMLARGEFRDFPYLILERFAGDDLGNVYGRLTSAQRKRIASEVCRIQGRVGTLPEGPGFGHVRLPAGPYQPSWSAVIDASLARSRSRMEATSAVSLRAAERVTEYAGRFSPYFASIRPTPFLDDTTTKNVIVHEGRLSGIVDVDWLCFGDPLFTVALTRTALLSADQDLEYTDHWCRLLQLSPDQTRVLHFYSALFCVDFLSDFGQRFNREVVEVDSKRLALLEKILDDELSEV